MLVLALSSPRNFRWILMSHGEKTIVCVIYDNARERGVLKKLYTRGPCHKNYSAKATGNFVLPTNIPKQRNAAKFRKWTFSFFFEKSFFLNSSSNSCEQLFARISEFSLEQKWTFYSFFYIRTNVGFGYSYRPRGSLWRPHTSRSKEEKKKKGGRAMRQEENYMGRVNGGWKCHEQRSAAEATARA